MKPEEIKELVPDEIKELFLRERENRATKDEREKIFMFIEDLLSEYPDIKLTSLLKQMGYAPNEYVRFMNRYRRWREQLTKPPKKLKRLEQRAFAKFIEEAWGEVRDIALDVVMGWYDKAKEMGYYNPDSQKVDMRRFIEDAVTFYTQYKYSIDSIEEQFYDLEAYAKTLTRMLEPQLYRLITLRLYMNFTLKIMELQAYGIPVPEDIIYEVKELTNRVLEVSPPLVRIEKYE